MTQETSHGHRLTPARTMTWTWLVLVAITLGSWRLAPAQFHNGVDPSIPITALVLFLTVIKVRLIIRNFMEVRVGPRWLKVATDGWLGVLFVSVFAIYLF